ncbi:MAG: hypothetical protein AAF449_22785 [Myxococcota bacterium]
MKTDMLRKIKAGDAISIDAVGGVVVFSSITDSYSLTFPKFEWTGPQHEGIMIQQENGALIFHDTEYLMTDYCRVELL